MHAQDAPVAYMHFDKYALFCHFTKPAFVAVQTDVKFHLRFTFNSKETISPEPRASFTAVSVSLQAVEATSV